MEITPEIVRELLHYDPETGIFTWRERDHRWFKTGRDCRKWNSRYAGKRAGVVAQSSESGYRRRHISIFKRIIKEHHLAWLWMTDEPLPPQIDHRNRDATDNRWSNLRSSTSKKNSRNLSLSRRNTSRITGVSWHKFSGKWRAHCRINGRYRHIGYFDDIDDAAKAVSEFRAAHGFDPEHGAELAHYHR